MQEELMELFGITIGMAALWIIAAVIFIIIEAATLGLTTIWFAGGAVAAALSTVFTAPVIAQVVIFLVVSILLIYSTKSWKAKFKIGNEKTNVEAIVGQTGFVMETISPSAYGQVKVGGIIWTAMSSNPNALIDAGTEITVAGVEGVKLIVVPVSNQSI
jgi:membrane protein implicated in regulation of membrane protease activity